MIYFLKREWKYWHRELILQLVIALLVPLTVFFVYKINNSILFRISSYVFSLPQEIIGFLGLSVHAKAGNITFYIMFTVMFLNVWLAWTACTRAVRSIYREEQTGSVYVLCNQICSRRQLYAMKYIWAVISFVAGYMILGLEVIFLIVTGSVNRVQRVNGCKAVFGVFGKGIPVIIMLISVTMVYAVFSSSKKEYRSFVYGLLLGTICVGNLYKIRDIAIFVCDYLDIALQSIKAYFSWLDGLYWISPLSWLNPYNSINVKSTLIQEVICLIFAAAAFFIGLIRYERRTF